MFEIIMFTYFKIGIILWILTNIVIFIRLNMMPWEAILIAFGVLFRPKELFVFIKLSFFLIALWPFNLLALILGLWFKVELKKENGEKE